MIWTAAMALAAPDPESWALTDLFESPSAFEAALKASEDTGPLLRACKVGGGVPNTAEGLAACFRAQDATAKAIGRLSSWADNHVAQNQRDDRAVSWKGAVGQLTTRIRDAMSFFEPGLLALGDDRLKALEQDPALATWRVRLRHLREGRSHVLGAEAERVLALSGDLTAAPSNLYGLLTYANLPYPTIQVDGADVRLDPQAFTRVREHADPAVRKSAFEAFFGTFASFQDSYGALVGTAITSHIFESRARNWPDSMTAALGQNHVPASAYEALIAGTTQNLPTLHRYLRLRKTMMGLETLGYWDLYAPLVEGHTEFPIAKGKAIALAAAAPMGPAYVSAMRDGLDARWMDTYPREGKQGGAYMDPSSATDVHPFVLMNYNNDWDGVSTLAHEWGHAMHTVLSTRAQPYATSDYPIFLAEVASTLQEHLLLDHALKQAKTDDERLFYLGHALETLRTTWFRQAMFARFEAEIHAAAESGEGLTGIELTRRYLGIVRETYGTAGGVCEVSDAMGLEWATIPHFYYNYYVYQYATSVAASAQLAEAMLTGPKRSREAARDRVLTLLAAGSSDDPLPLLAAAGVDMTTTAPYDALARRMDAIIDEIEGIIAKRRGLTHP